jgi:hypothetical protein
MTTAPFVTTYGPCKCNSGAQATRPHDVPEPGVRSVNGLKRGTMTLYLCEACYELELAQAAMMYGPDGDETRRRQAVSQWA